MLPRPPHRRPASAPASRVTRPSAGHRSSARPCSAHPQPSEVHSTWVTAIIRAEEVDRKLRQDAQARYADRSLARIIQTRALRAHTAERTKHQTRSATHRTWHEQEWARQEEHLQTRQTTAATARLQHSHRRHKATQQWRSQHNTRTQQIVHSRNRMGTRDRAPPTLGATPHTPEDNQREALMRSKIDGAQSAVAKERFAQAQLPHEQSLAAHVTRYQHVRAIKGTVAAKELCDRHQIEKERELVFSEGRPSLQLTMRTTLGLELTQKSRARAIKA